MGYVLYRLGMEPWYLVVGEPNQWVTDDQRAPKYNSQRAATAARARMGLCAAEVHVKEVSDEVPA